MPPETTPAPLQNAPAAPKIVVAQRATLGSLAAAMAVGALLAVTGLYFWGAEVEHDRSAQEANATSGAQ